MESEAPSLVTHLARRARDHESVLRFQPGASRGDLAWQTITAAEFAGRVAKLAKWLTQQQVTAGDRVILLSENRLEWLIADAAILAVGAVSVPLHTTLSASQLSTLTERAEPALAIISTSQLAALLEQNRWPVCCRNLLLLDSIVDASSRFSISTTSLEDVLAKEFTFDAVDYLSSLAEAIHGDQLASIVFTSGTSASPRGVMLSHRNLAFEAERLVAMFGTTVSRRRLVELPLSHLLSRTCDFFCWLVMGGEMALAASPTNLMADLATIRPTYLIGVPRLFERIAMGLRQQNVANIPGILQKVTGGELLACTCGGASLSSEVAEFFASRGITIFEGYGLTEASPVVSLNTPSAHRPATLGRAVLGTEIDLAADGEIMVRGEHVMLGYWRDDAATRETIHEGWLMTGDLGTIDADGFLQIVGRKKEMIVASSGRKVFPASIEAKLTSISAVCHALVIGEGRSSLAAMLVVHCPQLRSEFSQIDSAGRLTDEELVAHPSVKQRIAEQVKRQLAGGSSSEQVRRLLLVPGPFADPGDRVTAKFTLARPVILREFAAAIDAMYEQPTWPELIGDEGDAR